MAYLVNYIQLNKKELKMYIKVNYYQTRILAIIKIKGYLLVNKTNLAISDLINKNILILNDNKLTFAYKTENDGLSFKIS